MYAMSIRTENRYITHQRSRKNKLSLSIARDIDQIISFYWLVNVHVHLYTYTYTYIYIHASGFFSSGYPPRLKYPDDAHSSSRTKEEIHGHESVTGKSFSFFKYVLPSACICICILHVYIARWIFIREEKKKKKTLLPFPVSHDHSGGAEGLGKVKNPVNKKKKKTTFLISFKLQLSLTR